MAKESSETKLPSLGPMSDDTLRPFMGIVEKWLNRSPPINRLAFGAALGRPTADVQTGYKDMQRYIPVVDLDRQGIADFLYRINIPRESKVRPNIMINCLNSWTVALRNTVTVEHASPKADIQSQYICKLDLDINTPLSKNCVATSNAYQIFCELVEYGREISNNNGL